MTALLIPSVEGMNTTTDRGPLTREHQQQMADADKRVGKVRRAAKAAAFNGWSIGIFAALSMPFA